MSNTTTGGKYEFDSYQARTDFGVLEIKFLKEIRNRIIKFWDPQNFNNIMKLYRSSYQGEHGYWACYISLL